MLTCRIMLQSLRWLKLKTKGTKNKNYFDNVCKSQRGRKLARFLSGFVAICKNEAGKIKCKKKKSFNAALPKEAGRGRQRRNPRPSELGRGSKGQRGVPGGQPAPANSLHVKLFDPCKLLVFFYCVQGHAASAPHSPVTLAHFQLLSNMQVLVP